MSDYVIAMSAFPSREAALPVMRTLVTEKLVACAQAIDMTSVYTWDGSVVDDTEVLVLLKTRSALYPQIEQRVLELHPYDTAEVLQLPITAGFGGYLAWIDESTLPDPTI